MTRQQATDSLTLPSEAPASIAALLASWRTVARQRPPREADFPFERLVDGHPGICLIAPVEANGRPDYRFLRTGPAHLANRGFDVTGRLYSEMAPTALVSRVSRLYATLLETGEPDYRETASTMYGTPPAVFARLLLPLYDDGDAATRLLGEWVWLS